MVDMTITVCHLPEWEYREDRTLMPDVAIPDFDEILALEGKIAAYVAASSEPVDMRDLIHNYAGVHDEGMVRACVWYLIDQQRLDFTPERLLIPKGTA